MENTLHFPQTLKELRKEAIFMKFIRIFLLSLLILGISTYLILFQIGEFEFGRNKENITVFIIDYTDGRLTRELISFNKLFIDEGIPVNYFIIPESFEEESSIWLRTLERSYPELVQLDQHGYMHIDFDENDSECYEFGRCRNYSQQYEDILRGKERLQDVLGDSYSPLVFTPPGYKFDENTLLALENLNFSIISTYNGAGLKSNLISFIGRIFKKIYFLGYKISYQNRKLSDYNITDLSTCLIVDYDSSGEVIKSKERLIKEFNRCRKIHDSFGIALNERLYQDKEKMAILKEFILDLKKDPSIHFGTIENIASGNDVLTLEESFGIKNTQDFECLYFRLKDNQSVAGDRSNITVFFRDDDVGLLTDALRDFNQVFIDENVPISYEIIPNEFTEETASWLRNLKKEYPDLIQLDQHGYTHKNYDENDFTCYEFGKCRTYNQQYDDILRGKEKLEGMLGDSFSPVVFTPPGYKFDENTLRVLEKAEFKIISYSSDNCFHNLKYGINEYDLLWANSCVEVDYRNGTSIFKTDKQLINEFNRCRKYFNTFGVALHHRKYKDKEKLIVLRKFIQELKKDPSIQFVTIGQLEEDSNIQI